MRRMDSNFLTLRRLGRDAVDVDSLAAAAVEEHSVSGVAVDWMWMRVLSQPVTFVHNGIQVKTPASQSGRTLQIYSASFL